MEAFTTKGHWWLPGDDPENAIAGILTFDPRGQSKLEMFDAFESWEDMGAEGKVEPVILGYGDKGQAVTLLNCLHLGSGFAISNNLWRSATYVLGDVIQGKLFESKEIINFDQMRLEFYGLESWASSGKGWNLDRVQGLTVVRSAEDDILVELDGFNLVFRRRYSWSGDKRSSFSVNQSYKVDFVTKDAWEYEDFITKIYQIQLFLSLAMRIATWPESIEAPDPSEPKWKLSIHFSPSTDFQENRHLSTHDMYFNLEGVRPKLALCLRNWFAKFDKLEQALRLYNLTISKRVSLEQRFLTLAKAVEAYHRQMLEETFVDKEEFDKVKEDLKRPIKSCIPSEGYKDLRRRIYESINLANSPSLKDRFVELQERHQVHNQRLFEEFESFAKDVVSTRDQLTHYFDTAESTARLDAHSLLYMSEKLRLILELCLLSELGFCDEELQQMAAKNIPQDPGRPEKQAPQPAASGE